MKKEKEAADERLAKAVKKLKTAPDSEAFLKPVNWKKLKLVDYANIVKKPMDLETVEKQLKNGVYKDPIYFWNDIDLIWKNCQLYNHPESEVFGDSREMEKIAWNARIQWEFETQKDRAKIKAKNIPNKTGYRYKVLKTIKSRITRMGKRDVAKVLKFLNLKPSFGFMEAFDQDHRKCKIRLNDLQDNELRQLLMLSQTLLYGGLNAQKPPKRRKSESKKK